MYMKFYGLAKQPFNMTPDPSFLYLTKQHREALSGLSYAIVDRKGFLVLSGVAGCGKTTLLAWVLGKLPTDQVQSSVILNPMLKPEEFMEMVMLDFGITDIPDSKARRLWALQNFLVQGHRDGKVNVLIVDEAHKLSPELLEEIRLLGNLERGTDKLLQILLTGQPELDELIGRPELWQFKQRVSVRLALEALAPEEVEKYIQHRWSTAGGKVPAPFSTAALAAVLKRSKGIPRLVNALCDNALILAFADQSATVGEEHIEAAAQDLLLIPKAAPAPVVVIPAAVAVPMAVGALAHVPAAAPVAVATSTATAAAVATPPAPAAPPVPAAASELGALGETRKVTRSKILVERQPAPFKPSFWVRLAYFLGFVPTNGNGRSRH